MLRTLLAVTGSFAVSSVLLAQPPNFASTWSGGTANTQPQGFGQGNPLTLTWGFMASGTPINDSAHNGGRPDGNNNLQTRLNTIYGSQATWQPIFQSIFDRWSSISGLNYQFEANDDGAAINTNTFPGGSLGVRADLRIGGKNIDGNSGVLAYNYFPTVGEMIIDTNDTFYNNTTGGSIGLRNVISHEHGHGLGMNHMQTNDSSFLMEPFINTSFDGPQYHDILVAQRGYGDFHEKSFSGLGNDVATRATSIGSAFGVGQNRSIGNSARTKVVASTAVDFVSIDDNTDTDFISFTISSPGRMTAFLEALGFVYNITNQAGAGNVAFDTRARIDLALDLFDTNGTTLLASVNATGLGGNELLSFDLLNAGTYFLRVSGTDNPDAIFLDTQFYGLSLSLAAVPEPATIALMGFVSLGTAGAWWQRRRKALKASEQSI